MDPCLLTQLFRWSRINVVLFEQKGLQALLFSGFTHAALTKGN